MLQAKLSELNDLLSHTTRDKIQFHDEVKVSTNEGIIYIPHIKKVLNNWLANVQTNSDSGYRNINQLDINVLDAIYNKVMQVVGQKRRVA